MAKKYRKNMTQSENSRSEKGQELKNKVLFSRRVVVLLLMIITGIGALLARMYYLQIKRHDHFRTRSERNRVKTEVTPPLRGNIFDRKGVALSENILSYDLVVNRAKTKNPDEYLEKIKHYVPLTEDDILAFQSEKKKKKFTQDIVVKKDLNKDQINHFLVDLHLFPGFDVTPSYRRYYPYGDLTAHIVGYINNINKKDQAKLDKKEYSGTTKIGRTGIENYYESELHGQAGFLQAEVSRTGRIVRVLENIDPVPGKDLFLSLDLKLQKVIRDELENGHFDGAGVAIDPRNGEVLALYSNPSFDANIFVNGISHTDYNILSTSPRKNLFNRAINGKYSPASSIKPMMALAALHNYIVTSDMKIDCEGSYRIPEYQQTKKFYCWKRTGHGEMDSVSSIAQSCDVYYYNIGKDLGIQRIHDYLSQFGLGKKTGIDLPNESDGILPNKSWKKKRYNKSWFIGDTINTSIGQGYMSTTPLQMAQFAAVLGSRGKVFTPHFVTHYRNTASGDLVRKMPKQQPDVHQNNPHAWDTISQSMIEVMYGKKGTGRKIKIDLPFKIAGKTGTAQVFSFRDNKRIKKKDLRKKLRDNSVFITYAPADNPVIALAVILENAGGGSEIAAPIAVEILHKYFAENTI